MRCPQCNSELSMPELACASCGTNFRGCPHCLTLVDVHEIFCTSCGRPLPGFLPEDEASELPLLSQPQASSERLTMLEIGPAKADSASEGVSPPTTHPSSTSPLNAKSGVLASPRLASESGVVEDERDPMDILKRHDPYDPYDIYRIDPFTVSPNVNPHYRRYLFFAHIFRLVFALALLAFFYRFLWPHIKPLTEFEIEGISMAWYADALALAAIGLVIVILVYAISYFIIYRPFGKRNPRDGS